MTDYWIHEETAMYLQGVVFNADVYTARRIKESLSNHASVEGYHD